jgi:hypothetical protein
MEVFESFLWSATGSNFVRIIATYIFSQDRYLYSNNPTDLGLKVTISAHSNSVGFFVRLISFLERNPSAVLLLALTNVSSVFGLQLKDYILAIPLMNISIAIAAFTWNQFENTPETPIVKTIFGLLAAALVTTLFAASFIFLAPPSFIHADSIEHLNSSPFLLIGGPIFFGFSTGLAVFTYGQITAFSKVFIITLNFLFLGSFGFYSGVVINCVYLLISRIKSI